MPNAFAFISYILLTAYTPGPNNIMTMANASRVGFRRGMRFNAGILAGFFVVSALALAFSLTLYRLLPNAKPVMTVLGAAYILWLAWQVLRSRPHESESERELGFTLGMLLQLVNPKVVLYCITVMATFVLPYYRSWSAIAGFAVLISFVGFSGSVTWSLFGATFKRLLARHHTVINAVLAALLVYCAVSLFFE